MDLKKDLWSFRDTRDTYENSMKTRLVTWRILNPIEVKLSWGLGEKWSYGLEKRSMIF